MTLTDVNNLQCDFIEKHGRNPNAWLWNRHAWLELVNQLRYCVFITTDQFDGLNTRNELLGYPVIFSEHVAKLTPILMNENGSS